MSVAGETGDLPPLTVVARASGLLVAQGASLGLCAWASSAGTELTAYATSNIIADPMRRHMLGAMVAGAGIASILAVVLALRWRRGGVDLLSRVAHRSAPLCLAGLVPFLFEWRLWIGRDLTFLVLAGVFGLALQGLTQIALATAPVLDLDFSVVRAWKRRPFTVLRWRGLPLLIACLLGTFCAAYFGYYTVVNHHNIHTSAYDLGIETNLVWHAAHGGPLFHSTPLGGSLTHLGMHHTFFAYAMAPVLRLFPYTETLLVLQSIFMGAATIPLFLVARRRVGPWIACLVVCLLALYPPFHGAILYDFHYQPLSTFFLLMCLQLLEARRNWWAALFIVLTLSLREDIAALVTVIGAYLVLTGRRPRAGLVVAVVAAAFFVIQKMIVMPLVWSGASAFINQYKDLLPEGEHGYGGVLKTVFGNPAFTLQSLLEQEKAVYVLQLFAPLAFVPWRRPAALLLFLPGFFFTLLETKYNALIRISFQYPAYWTPFVFLAATDVIAWLGRTKSYAVSRASLVAMTASMLVCSNQHGAVLQHHTAGSGYGSFAFGRNPTDDTRHDDLYALIAQIPATASVLASEQVVPHVSCRPDAYSLRVGPHEGDYLLIGLPINDSERQPIKDLLSSATYGVVAVRGDFSLAKRGHPADQNQKVLARVAN
jgi:uncharacterized membrane protein